MCKKKQDRSQHSTGNLYNKVRKSSRAAADLLEARAMHYVLYEATHKIAQTPERAAKLQNTD